jgi:RNA polymerase sigma-70 factor (ECF subfamily)
MGAVGKLNEQLRDLYESEVNYVACSLRRLGARASELDDLTQEVFVRMLQHIERFDPSRPIRPWLFGIAFRVISETRRGQWRIRAVEEHEFDDPPDPAATPEQAAEGAQARAFVLRALEELSPERRAVFVMYELNGHAMSEVAETLGTPLFTAYSRLRVARAQFAVAVRRLRDEDAMGGRRS